MDATNDLEFILPPDVLERINKLTPYQRQQLIEADKRIRARRDVDNAAIDWHAVVDHIERTCTPWHARRDAEYRRWLRKLPLHQLELVHLFMQSANLPHDWTVKSVREAVGIKTRGR